MGVAGGHDLRMAPTLVLLHGFTHTGASWNRVVAALGERYRPLAPDIRGHGSASDREPVDIEHVIEDVAAVAPSSFVLAGYSMGGRIAVHAALALGERVTRLVLISASPGLADAAERAARREADDRLAQEAETATIEEFARRWAETPGTGRTATGGGGRGARRSPAQHAGGPGSSVTGTGYRGAAVPVGAAG
jgi:2-succinyl-6-hydroxy-2,4-cyclohexadiene-1-carboxylate synthase